MTTDEAVADQASGSEVITHYHVISRLWGPEDGIDDFSEQEILTAVNPEPACRFARLDAERLMEMYNATREEGVDPDATVDEKQGFTPVTEVEQVVCRYRTVNPVNGAVSETRVESCGGSMVGLDEFLAGFLFDQFGEVEDSPVLH